MLHNKDEKFVNDEVKEYIVSEVSGCELDTHGFSISDRVIKSLEDKISRFRKKDISEEETDVPFKCITTCICQAFYFVIRDMYNDWNNGGHKDNYTKDERSAQWMFIREFCFGSMFRFGPNGDFNIPYGGFGYNTKCFSCKVENVTSEEVKTLFKATDIKCKDFEEVINGWNFEDGDFMFLDPPYDSIFTDYDGNGFTREDHKRLAECLKNCECKWLMAIGKTDFIEDLYKDYYVVEYDKTYMYQARGEYDSKHTTHLVITNYPIKVDEEENASE
jgi:DNA adenine methylase